MIPELACSGVVVAIYCCDTGIQYSVRYFIGGKAEQCYFHLWELAPMEAV